MCMLENSPAWYLLLCLRTIPVSFVASLSNVESLTKLLPFLKEPVENYAWLAGLLALLAPLLLVVFISLLPYIILFIIKFEGLVEIETMQVSIHILTPCVHDLYHHVAIYFCLNNKLI